MSYIKAERDRTSKTGALARPSTKEKNDTIIGREGGSTPTNLVGGNLSFFKNRIFSDFFFD